ncbi:MAG: cupin domain-containing protein [Acetobacteraceae bacterium]
MLKRHLAAASLGGLLALAGPAFAGGCPTDKVVQAGQGQPQSDAKAVGVTDVVVTSIDVSKEPASIQDRLFRLRKLTIQPGGIVPWHSHGDRPALITIVEGEVVEYASTCTVPIVHRAGDSTAETHTTAHWWKNLGKKTVVLYSADLFPMKTSRDEHMM